MTERLAIAGVELERFEQTGITYTCPATLPPIEHIELAHDLSSDHAEGGIVRLKADPNKEPSQRAYILASNPQPPKFITGMGNIIMKGVMKGEDDPFGNMLDRIMANRQKVQALKRIGEHLENKDAIFNCIQHDPSLLNIGLEHALLYMGLVEVGSKFRAGIMLSQGVTGLGYDFNGIEVSLPTALSWASNKIWLVTPRTYKVEHSKYSETVDTAETDERNSVVLEDIEGEQEEGGIFITVALSGTSLVFRNNIYWSLPPNPRMLEVLAHPRSYIQIVIGDIYAAESPIFELWRGLRKISGNRQELIQQGHELMEDVTLGHNESIPHKKFAYTRDPKTDLLIAKTHDL